MPIKDNLYPVNPSNVAESITQPSPAFRSEVKKVMTSILLFFIVYILLMVLAVALTVFCVYIGIAVISNVGHWLGIVAGVGIISIGIMVFIFLVKFIFSVKKFDESSSIEISEKDQPQLFAFIRQLTIDTQTQFPKKIIVSSDVNACVFYNDSFWSMIFPVKKNLQIGLGLVNTLTLSEFKAVMAHEFGHFSQRSMKLGSFVYNVNKAIYNMLYENKGYGKFLQGFGNLHAVLSFFVMITIEIVKGIQKMLQGMYGFINKNYMGLSREMEFHADAVAASVSGGNNLITALRKAEVSDVCFNTAIQKANDFMTHKKFFENIYAKHNVIMKQYASVYKLPVQGNVPIVNDEFFKQFQLSKVNIKDQWASHPSREDREEKLKNLAVEAEPDDRSAWLLFNDPSKLQGELTAILYKNVPVEMKEHKINEKEFSEKYLDEIITYRLPQEYKGFYDNRQISDMDPDAVFLPDYKGEINSSEMEKLFSPENLSLPKHIVTNQGDAGLLQGIINKQIDTKTFDYDGEKFERSAAPELLEKLNKETEQLVKELKALDERIVSFFAKASRNKGNEGELKKKYKEHFENRKKAEQFLVTAQKIVDTLSPLLRGEQVSIESANTMASFLRREGNEIKPLLSLWVNNGLFDSDTSLKEKVERFVAADYQYFADDSFFDSELGDIYSLANETATCLGDFQFLNFKKILEYQLALLK